MAIDDAPAIPAEYRNYVRQNWFSGVYVPPTHDTIHVNIYQDVFYTQVSKSSYVGMTTGLNVVLDNIFEFGPFCSYILDTVSFADTHKPGNTVHLSPYYYCGAMLGVVPLAEKTFHPVAALNLGFGDAHGKTLSKDGISETVNYTFVVIKPSLALETNLLSFLQWTLSAQYRFQIPIQNPSLMNLGSNASGVELATGLDLHF